MIYGDNLELNANYTSMILFDDHLSFAMAKSSHQPTPEQVPITKNFMLNQEFMVLTKGFGFTGSA
ncbi:hypothetical protein P4S72_07435 [Vibrio sp. PP-XX7]